MGPQAIAARLILGTGAAAVIAALLLPDHAPAGTGAARKTARTVVHHYARAAPGAKVAVPTPLPPGPPAAPIDPLATMTVKRVLDLGGPIKFGDFAWNDKGVPAGPLIITVDLAAQTLSVFRNGYEIGATAILYGADNKPTPLGTFPITQKDATHVSNLYDAPMPYMLRLTNDGVSIHGSKVEWGYATHGCIGVPLAFAKRLFGEARLGDRVIITNGKTLIPNGALAT